MENIVQKYQNLKPFYDEFNERIKGLLTLLIDDRKIKYHLIESRTKSVQSFKEKIQRKEKEYISPLEEITDLVGFRIIVYYLDDVDKIETIVKNEFQIDPVNSVDKGKLLKTNEFGYQSVHYVFELSSNRYDLPEWKKFKKLKAEIQIRTVLQHSWASISHELEYKKNYDIPSVLKRRLFRLASLIELADEEFIITRDKHNELSEIISIKETDTGNLNTEIIDELNLLTLKDYISKSTNIEVIAKQGQEVGFLVEDYENDNYISQILYLCDLIGIKSITEFDKLIGSLLEKSTNYFKYQFNENQTSWTVSPGFLALLLLISVSAKHMKDSSILVNNGWSENIAYRVIEVALKNPIKK